MSQEENFKKYIVLTLFSFCFLNRKENGVEKCWTLGIVKDMQMQITKIFQLTPVRMAMRKNSVNKKC